MEKLFLAIGVALLGCAVVAVGMYAWNGHWLPVLLTVSAAFVGKMALGLVEIILTPLTRAMIYFAERGKNVLSFIFAVLLSIIGRAAFAAYCMAVLLYFIRTPGPPTWLAVALAVLVASAPFHWASQRTQDDEHPAHLDLFAALGGVTISGTLIIFDINLIFALSPIALLFFLSAIALTVWWVTKGAPQARFNRFIDSEIS